MTTEEIKSTEPQFKRLNKGSATQQELIQNTQVDQASVETASVAVNPGLARGLISSGLLPVDRSVVDPLSRTRLLERTN